MIFIGICGASGSGKSTLADSLAAALGAVGGALLLNRVKLFWLRKLFGVILVYSGLKMVGLF